jgi:tetratricopeptide (TPR) repeat protein
MRLLCDEEATTAEITRALRSFVQQAAPEDLVLVYLASHGMVDPKRPERAYLVTHDTKRDDVAGTALPMREVVLSLRENVKAGKLVLIADVCHGDAIAGSAAFQRGPRLQGDPAAAAQAVSVYHQKLLAVGDGVALLLSCGDSELSREDKAWGDGHGVFTHFLLEGLEGKADKVDDGLVTVGDLFDYVVEKVKEATYGKQNPVQHTLGSARELPMMVRGGLRARRVGKQLYLMAVYLDDKRRFEAAARVLQHAVTLSKDVDPDGQAEAQWLYGMAMSATADDLFHFTRAPRLFEQASGGGGRASLDAGFFGGVALARLGAAHAKQGERQEAHKNFDAAGNALSDFAKAAPTSARAPWATRLGEWSMGRALELAPAPEQDRGNPGVASPDPPSFTDRSFDLLMVTELALWPRVTRWSRQQLERYYDRVLDSLDSSPANPVVFVDLHRSFGLALLDKGAIAMAARALETACAQLDATRGEGGADSDDVELWGALGIACLKQGRFADGAGMLSRVLTATGLSTEEHRALIAGLSAPIDSLDQEVQLARVAAALALFKRVMSAPLEQAVDLLKRMIAESSSADPGRYVNLGVALMLLGGDRLDEAEIALETAIVQKGSNYPEASYFLGRLLVEREGDFDRAVSELRRALSFDPSDAAALYYLGRAISAREAVQNPLQEAVRAWARYLKMGAPLGHRAEIEAFLAAHDARG